MSEGFADLGNGRLWYERAGEGFPVVFVHPGLMDARVWEPQFEEFAEQHEVVRYDRRGFGRSDPPTGPFSDLDDLRALLDELQIARCALVGCAEGSRLCFDLALAAPEAIEAVVASSPRVSGYPWRDPGAEVLAEQVARSVAAGDPQGAIELQLAVWAPVTSAADPGVRTVALENAAAQAIDPSWRSEPPASVDRLDELRAAALLIVGEEDIGEVGEIADLVAERVPGASKRVVAETDQLVNVGKSERFNRLALDFLAFAG
ncbi:MAG TPA: alpha/beta hydrolase [Actinomycetota bacterium]|nr:alpha/beta hydrolase [Actinomycetota bacterium]